MADNPIDDYADKTAAEVVDAIEANDYSDDELAAIGVAEETGKQRKTVFDAIAAATEDADDAGEVVPTEERDPQTPTQYWEAGEVPDSEDIPTVTVAYESTGGVAGLWFDEAGTKTVKRTRRVDRAIATGRLTIPGAE